MTTDPTTDQALTDEEREAIKPWRTFIAEDGHPGVEDVTWSELEGAVERIVAARVAEALREVEARIMDDPMWIGDDGKPLDYLPEREARIADFLDALRAVVSREPGEGDTP